jgi:hypothetical protein
VRQRLFASLQQQERPANASELRRGRRPPRQAKSAAIDVSFHVAISTCNQAILTETAFTASGPRRGARAGRRWRPVSGWRPPLSPGFPYIFRGALDARVKTLNMEMKLEAKFETTPKYETTLRVATHGPNLAAHVYELETIPRQLAECFPIAVQNRRHCAVLRIFDFVTIGQVEMSHGISNRLIVFNNAARVIQAIGRAIHRRLELHKMQCNYFC